MTRATLRRTIRRARRSLGVGLLVPLLVACGAGDEELAGGGASPTTGGATPTVAGTAPATVATATATTTAEATVTPPATIPQADLPEPVRLAIEAAANDAGVAPDDVGLIRFEERSWNDTSLGCPQPGGMYAQVITAGYDVRLLVAGREREYHTDMGSNIVRCGGLE